MATNNDSSVKVVVRVRPWSEREKSASIVPVVSTRSDQKEVSVIKEVYGRATSKKLVYNFDEVFTNFSTQQEVFETTLAPMIENVMSGYEATVFAYGQTGTGKTYTMEGDTSSEEHQGVIPRAIRDVFNKLETRNYKESSVKVTYLEIYNEELGDLLLDQNGSAILSPSAKKTSKKSSISSSNKDNRTSTSSMNSSMTVPPKLMIQEDKKKNGRGVFCAGLNEIEVKNVEDVLNILNQAQERRRVGETKMNKSSSRSHCLFSINVHTVEDNDGNLMDRTGRLNLCDLAGSECAKTAGSDSSGGMDRERKNINQSLLVLGRVITSLKGDTKNMRIPYRDSKLTRILQEALGGRSKTCIIATVSPSILAVDETMSTLNYAQQALGIKNKKQESSIKMVGGGGSSLNNSQGSGQGSGSGGGYGDMNSWNEMECKMSYMEAQVQEAQGMLGRKHEAMVEALNKLTILENEVDGCRAAEEEAITMLTMEKEEKSNFLGLASNVLSNMDTSRHRLKDENKANIFNVQELQESLIQSNEQFCSDQNSENISYQNNNDVFFNQIENSLNLSHSESLTDIDNILKMRIDEDEELTENVSSKSDVVIDNLSVMSESLISHEQTLTEWSEQMKELINTSNMQQNENLKLLQNETNQVCDHLNEDKEELTASLSEEEQELNTIHQVVKMKIEDEGTIIKDVDEMNDLCSVNALEYKKENGIITSNISQTSSNQINGRKKNEIDMKLESMKELVSETSNRQQIDIHKNTKLRLNQLDIISNMILTTIEEQQNGRTNKEIENQLLSMKKLVEKYKKELFISYKYSCEKRCEEMNKVINNISQTSNNQINGRKKNEIDMKLESMKELVTETSNTQQINIHKNTKLRLNQLDKISNMILTTIEEQQNGRKYKELLDELNSMKALETTMNSKETKIINQQLSLLNSVVEELKEGHGEEQMSADVKSLDKYMEMKASELRKNIQTQHQDLELTCKTLEEDNGYEDVKTQLDELTLFTQTSNDSIQRELNVQRVELHASSNSLETSTYLHTLLDMFTMFNTCVQENTQEQYEELDKQANELTKHGEKLNETLSSQKQAQNEMKTTLMETISNLFDQEFTKLHSKYTNSITELTEQNDQLKQDNMNLRTKVKESSLTYLKQTQDNENKVKEFHEFINHISEDINTTVSKSIELSEQLDEIHLNKNLKYEELNAKNLNWGESNKLINDNIKNNIMKQNIDLEKNVSIVREEINEQNNVLIENSIKWGKSNRKALKTVHDIINKNNNINDEIINYEKDFDIIEVKIKNNINEWNESDNEIIKKMKSISNDTNTCSENIQTDTNENIKSVQTFIDGFIPQQENALLKVAEWNESDDKIIEQMKSISNDTNICSESVQTDTNENIKSVQTFVDEFIPQQENALLRVAEWNESDDKIIEQMKSISKKLDESSNQIINDSKNIHDRNEKIINNMKKNYNSSNDINTKLNISIHNYNNVNEKIKIKNDKMISDLNDKIIKKCENDYNNTNNLIHKKQIDSINEIMKPRNENCLNLVNDCKSNSNEINLLSTLISNSVNNSNKSMLACFESKKKNWSENVKENVLACQNSKEENKNYISKQKSMINIMNNNFNENMRLQNNIITDINNDIILETNHQENYIDEIKQHMNILKIDRKVNFNQDNDIQEDETIHKNENELDSEMKRTSLGSISKNNDKNVMNVMNTSKNNLSSPMNTTSCSMISNDLENLPPPVPPN